MDNVNLTLVEREPDRLQRNVAAYVIPLLFIVILVVGLVGNGTLVHIVLQHKKMRDAPNLLIASIAMGHLLLLVLAVPIAGTTFTINYWPYGQFLCKLITLMPHFSMGISVFSLVALSGIMFNYTTKAGRSNPVVNIHPNTITVLAMCMAIWGLAFILALPAVVVARVIAMFSNMSSCTRIWPKEIYVDVYISMGFFVYFLIPVSVIFLLCVLSFGALKSQVQARRQMEARKTIQIVLALVIVHIITWLPRSLYMMWFQLVDGEFNQFWYVVSVVSFCLTYVSCCSNPVVLYCLSSEFRRYYNRHLFCCCCRGRDAQSDVGFQVTTEEPA